MLCTGKIQNIAKDFMSGQLQVTFTINEPSVVSEIESLREWDKLSIEVKKYRAKRSLDSNGLLWLCLGRIAEALHTDKWEVYLQMLKRYGQYTYVCVKPNVVDAMKLQWRELEVVGEIDINGQKAVQLLCYFGSSTYDSKQFSVLLDGVISEMKEMGLETPTSEDMRRAIELWEKQRKAS